jgi:hypothetical protein
MRALRRHHKERMKGRFRRIVRDNYTPDSAYMAEYASWYADNIQRCSCLMCGNKRHHEGPTQQERRAALYGVV